MSAPRWADLTAAERLARMIPLILAGTLPFAEVAALYAARDARDAEAAMAAMCREAVSA